MLLLFTALALTNVQIKFNFYTHKNSAMIRPNNCSQRWPKHVAISWVFKLISVHFCKCFGSIMLHIQLPHGSCIIRIKLPLHSKHKSSPSQQPDNDAINGSERLPS